MPSGKIPFNSQLLGEIYSCTYEKEKSGYKISNQIYGYDKKAHQILEIIRNNPDCFKKVEEKDSKYPKYVSKVNPLVNEICKDFEIDTNSKRKLRSLFDSQSFRNNLVYDKMVRNPDDILLFISIIASSVYVFNHYYRDKITEFKKLNFTMENVENIAKRVEMDFGKHIPSISEDTSSINYIGLGSKIDETLRTFPSNIIDHLISLSPLAFLIPQITIAVLSLNDILWEYRISSKKC